MVRVDEHAPDVWNGQKDGSDEGAKPTLDELLNSAGVDRPKSIRELRELDIKHNFIIEGVFVQGMTAAIAGASKGMKTSIAIDLAISLVTANRFLGKFSVPEPKRVLMFSVESGEASIKETAERVIKSKGLSDDLLDDQLMIHGDWVPRTGSDTDANILTAMIEEYGTDVVILDPTYFMIDGDNQANIGKQGQELRGVAEVVRKAGATPMFVDHVRLGSGNVKEHRPLELSDLSGAAKSAFFRQWLLVSRREKFDPNMPIHRLWMTYGGSHGRHGVWGVDIDETRNEADERIWGVELRERHEVAEEARTVQVRQTAARKAKRDGEKSRVAIASIRAAMPAGTVVSKSDLQTMVGRSGLQSAIAELIGRRELEIAEGKKPTGPAFSGLRWTKDAIHLSGST